MQNALIKSNGFVANTANILGCTCQILSNSFEYYPDLKYYKKDLQENVIDFAESQLFELMREKRNCYNLFLKTGGQSRSYSEKCNVPSFDFSNYFKTISSEVLDKLTYVNDSL